MKNFFIKFKDKLSLFFKGIIVGICMIVPGVSGGSLMVLLNIYDKLIDSINNLFKNFKESFSNLFPFALGIGVGFIALIYPLTLGLQHFPLIVVSLFAGLIIGGVPQLYKKVQGKETVKGVIIGLVSLSIMVSLLFIVTNVSIDFSKLTLFLFIYLFIAGILAAVALVVPGISGSSIMMIMGVYTPILLILGELLKFENLGHNLLILLPAGLGLIFGFFATSKLMGFLLKKHTINTYFSIIGFVIGSIFTMFYVTISDPEYTIDFSPISIILSILCLIGGFLLTFLLEKRLSKREKGEENETR